MNWRMWLRTTLQNFNDLTALIPAGSIYASGQLVGSPKLKPFIVMHTGSTDVVFNDGGAPDVVSNNAVIWVHDEPGSYDLIDEALTQVRRALIGQVAAPSGIACQWVGDSGELSNPDYGTLTRNGNYRLLGRT